MIVPNIIFLVIKNSGKTVHCFYEVSCKFSFGSLSFFVSLNRLHVVDAPAQYYYTTSFNYRGMKARNEGRIVDVLRAIFCVI